MAGYGNIVEDRREPMADEFAAELNRHRTYLLRVAQLQLRDRESAEDVVHVMKRLISLPLI